MRAFFIILLASFLSLHAAETKNVKASTKKTKVQYDKDTGLIIDKGVDIVKGNCTACHSAKFIILQKGDRDTWLAMIRWMQRTQGLWEFDKDTENTILTYLAKNYPPGKASRRPNLKPSELPKLK